MAEFYTSMREIDSVPFTSIIVRARPISMGVTPSAAGSLDWARLSRAFVSRRDGVSSVYRRELERREPDNGYAR